MISVNKGDADTLRVLFDEKYGIIEDRFNKVAVHSACAKGHLEVVKILVSEKNYPIDTFHSELVCVFFQTIVNIIF